MSGKRRKLTKEVIMASAANHSSRSAWRKADSYAYMLSHRLGIHEEVTAHMPRLLRRWTKENIMASAADHSCIRDWVEADMGAYRAALRHGVKDEATAHMTRYPIERRFRRSEEDILASARKHFHRYRWFKADQGGYRCAKRRGLFEKATAHMTLDVEWMKNKRSK